MARQIVRATKQSNANCHLDARFSCIYLFIYFAKPACAEEVCTHRMRENGIDFRGSFSASTKVKKRVCYVVQIY